MSETMTNAREVYASSVRSLSAQERLRLAALILEELAQAPGVLGWSDSWSEQDIHDLAEYSLRSADERYPEGESLV